MNDDEKIIELCPACYGRVGSLDNDEYEPDYVCNDCGREWSYYEVIEDMKPEGEE